LRLEGVGKTGDTHTLLLVRISVPHPFLMGKGFFTHTLLI
jgi:hypothetical protein